ncbi:uncharacterized protein LOC117296691 [Asterias rubens]|uniref:uncharacterized protein LOC117296691 n=1 Tax=Asterias rubens TaxID=7604 RepID=UPI00145543E7|nr:uncharacterized protein LOC117296691 [Asterias rubens]
MESHFEKSSIPVTSYPSSPEPSTDEIHHQLTDEGLHYMIQEQEEQLHRERPAVTIGRTVSTPERIFANLNLSGQQGFDEDEDEPGISRTPRTSPSRTSPISAATSPPTGIHPSEMRQPSTDRMYQDMVGDLDVMIDIARSMHEVARHTKTLISTAYERIDLNDPRVRNLGIGRVMKDLRMESAHAVVDGQRAQVRYEKVMTDVRRMKRCLRNLGFWHGGGHSGSLPGERQPSVTDSWAVWKNDWSSVPLAKETRRRLTPRHAQVHLIPHAGRRTRSSENQEKVMPVCP